MKIFYNDYLNRWTVSDEVNDRVLLRGLGSATECPTDSDWLIWNGASFEAPDLTEPWAPYVKSEQMLECRPTDFSIEKLKQSAEETKTRRLEAEVIELNSKIAHSEQMGNGVYNEFLIEQQKIGRAHV